MSSQSQYRFKLLDLPDIAVERVVYYAAYNDRGLKDNDRLPFHVLPISTTCKKLRAMASRLLTHDSLWLPNMIQPTIICDGLSNDVNDPIINLDPKVCFYKSCHIQHRCLAWYKLSTRLKSFDFSKIWNCISKRESVQIISHLLKNNVQLRELNLGCLYEEDQNEQLVQSLAKDVVSFSANSLERLSICMDNSMFIDMLSNIRLPNVKSLHAFMTRDTDRNFQQLSRLVKHCVQSGSQIEHFEIYAGKSQFGMLFSLHPHLKYLKSYSLNALEREITELPSVAEMNLFPFLQEITILNWSSPQDDDTMVLITHFAIRCETLGSIHLKNCQPYSLKKALQNYGYMFGSKIKTLELCWETDSNGEAQTDTELLDELHVHCPNIENLLIVVHYSEYRHVRSMLRNMFCLKTLKLHYRGKIDNTQHDIKHLIYGLRICPSYIEHLEVCNVMVDHKDILNLLFSHGYTLEYFNVTPVHAYVDLEDLMEICRTLLAEKRELSIRKICFNINPYDGLWVAEYEEIIRFTKDLKTLFTQLMQLYKHLDLSDTLKALRNSVRIAIISLANREPNDGSMSDEEDHIAENEYLHEIMEVLNSFPC